MARTKKTTGSTSSKSIKRRLPINASLMTKVEPLTPNQERLFKAWNEGKHMFIYG